MKEYAIAKNLGTQGNVLRSYAKYYLLIIDECLLYDDRSNSERHPAAQAKCISTRYLLSEKMPEQGKLLREDILSNFGTDYGNDPVY